MPERWAPRLSCRLYTHSDEVSPSPHGGMGASDDDRNQAFQEATTLLASYYGAGTVSRQRAELWLAYGPPAAVIAKIQAYIEAGCTTPGLRFVSPNLTAQLHRCIAEVLPACRAA